jgi:hypothetical protein
VGNAEAHGGEVLAFEAAEMPLRLWELGVDAGPLGAGQGLGPKLPPGGGRGERRGGASAASIGLGSQRWART